MISNAAEEKPDLPTFVARIWLEPGRDGSRLWRGRVQHVHGDRDAYFRSFDELRTFLEDVIGVPGPAMSAGDQAALQ